MFLSFTTLEGVDLWEGYRESRRRSKDTYPDSYITKYTSIRRITSPTKGDKNNSGDFCGPGPAPHQSSNHVCLTLIISLLSVLYTYMKCHGRSSQSSPSTLATHRPAPVPPAPHPHQHNSYHGHDHVQAKREQLEPCKESCLEAKARI